MSTATGSEVSVEFEIRGKLFIGIIDLKRALRRGQTKCGLGSWRLDRPYRRAIGKDRWRVSVVLEDINDAMLAKALWSPQAP